MEWNDFHKSWNPPSGDIPLSHFDSPRVFDEKFRGESLYKFPWYLYPLKLWCGLKHWLGSGQWPVSILYFPTNQHADKELFLKVHAEITNSPNRYWYATDAYWNPPVDFDIDELIAEEEPIAKKS